MASSQYSDILNQYNQTLHDAGLSGEHMGDSFWNSAPVLAAQQKYQTAAQPIYQGLLNQANSGKSNLGRTDIAIPQIQLGDAANHGGFATQFRQIISNPIPQIFAALATAGSAFPATLGGLGAAATALPNAISSGISSLGGLTGIGNSVGGLFGDASLGTDIGNGFSKFISPITNAASSVKNGVSDFLGGTNLSTGSGLTDFRDGLSGAATDNPITSAARQAISGSASTPTSSLSLPSGGIAGGGTPGGFASALGRNISDLGTSTGPLADALRSPLTNPLNTLSSGVKNVLSPTNLLNGGLKLGLAGALQKNNTGGYTALQNAATQAAGNFQPFLASGTAANKTLSDLQGLNGPDAQAAAMSGFQADPGYQFARDQGIKALDASAAGRGMLVSGNQQRAVQDYGTGLANQYYNQYFNRLANTSAQGQSAAEGVGQNNVDAATAYAALKANKANNFNSVLRGFANFL